MLLKCPECELNVSDKAGICPHCGFPLKKDSGKAAPRKPKRRKRLPNGFGQISEIKGLGLRKPFRALVTVGKTTEGKPISKPLRPEAYFATYNEAYEALIEYHRNPYDFKEDVSMTELYERWSESYFKSLSSDSSKRTIQSSWQYCVPIQKMRVSDVRVRHLKSLLDDAYKMVDGQKVIPSAGVKARIKSMMNLMFDYALECELVDRNYARHFNIGDDIIKEAESSYRGHIPFTDDEMNMLWENQDFLWVDVVLLQCYSGWRPQELGLIELKNVDLQNWNMTGGIKTDAGKNRVVPIHPRIREIVKAKYDEAVELGSDYLLNCTDTKTHRSNFFLTYDKYAARFEKVVKYLHLNPEHKPHDCRKQFVTMAKKYNVDEYAIKLIIGHEINDLTERVYTQREKNWLHKEIQKIR